MATTTELSAWLNGTATGGPNGDGKYPLTSSSGDVVLVPCPAVSGTAAPIDLVFGDLAFKDQVDWNTDVLNKPAPGAGTGSVTSVSVADATGITWSGSPITGAGTLTPTLSTNLQGWSAIAPATKANAATTLAGYGITNGLNSDLLINKTLADANSPDTAGTVTNYLTSAATNKPTGTDHAILTLRYSALWSAQMASDWRTNNWYVRNQNNGTWGAWTSLWHSGNFNPATKANTATTLAGYGITDAAPKASPTFTGVPAGPTAAIGTNTTQLATTAYTVAEIGSRAPTKTGTGASGTWAITITGTAPKLTTARTIAISGGATGTATSFDGSANISIPITALAAASLTGTVPSAALSGTYSTAVVLWANVSGKPVAVTTTVDGFMTAADKTKLDGIAASANNYTHPATHPATIIVDDATHRWFTDTERTKLTGIEAAANNYVHPTTHPATIIVEDSTHRWLTDAERTKLTGIEAAANNYTHPATHPATIIVEDSNHRFVTDAEKAAWNLGGGGSGGGGLAWTATNINSNMLVGVGYIATAAITLTLPANVPNNSFLAVCASNGEVIINTNGNNVHRVGPGNNIKLRTGESVFLACGTIGILEIV